MMTHALMTAEPGLFGVRPINGFWSRSSIDHFQVGLNLESDSEQ